MQGVGENLPRAGAVRALNTIFFAYMLILSLFIKPIINYKERMIKGNSLRKAPE